MMDFDNILNIATQNQGYSGVQKRYSLQTGPPKKDPKSKGVNPAAVQALLKKQHNETKKKEIQKKKQKETLLAKRIELKSDRKARAMASRTKDNFKGYNGIPVVEGPKKRGSKLNTQQFNSDEGERFRNDTLDPLDDEDNYEYEQTDSETEQEQEPLRPGKATGVGGSSGSSKLPTKKSCGPPKPAPPPMNFADLLRLAEKKQFEPVELKPKVKKEERLYTADEIRELEMERRAKRLDKNRDSKVEKEREVKSQSSSSAVKKGALQKEQKQSKPQKNVLADTLCFSKPGKKPAPTLASDRNVSSSKSSISNREKNRVQASRSNGERGKSASSTSSAMNSKVPSKVSQVSAKQVGSRPLPNHKSSTSSDLKFRTEGLSLLQKGTTGNKYCTGASSSTGQRSHQGSSQQSRTNQVSALKHGPAVGGLKPCKGELLKPGVNSAVKSSSSSMMRPPSGGSSRPLSQPPGRPGGTPQTKPGSMPQVRPGGRSLQGHPGGGAPRPPGPVPSRPSSGGPVPGRPTGSFGSGPGRPKCTVVSETISSKNFGGPRPGVPPRPAMPQRPGMVPRPGMPPRPIMNRPPGTMLPPITSAYKRKYEDEEAEYDSEMDDFIDNGGEEQEEISRHIREIFGYDRSRYRDESDYALKFMESSWKDIAKEEARSLRLAVQEDLEEEKKEEEEMKRKKLKRQKTN